MLELSSGVAGSYTLDNFTFGASASVVQGELGYGVGVGYALSPIVPPSPTRKVTARTC